VYGMAQNESARLPIRLAKEATDSDLVGGGFLMLEGGLLEHLRLPSVSTNMLMKQRRCWVQG
jgi:hypothetical protein